MTHPFSGSGACAGVSMSIKGCGFLEPEDDSPDLFCRPYGPILVVTGQPGVFMKCRVIANWVAEV